MTKQDFIDTEITPCLDNPDDFDIEAIYDGLDQCGYLDRTPDGVQWTPLSDPDEKTERVETFWRLVEMADATITL